MSATRYSGRTDSPLIPFLFRAIFVSRRLMLKPSCIPALAVAVLLSAQSTRAQDERQMQFVLGKQNNQLQVQVQYYDPSELDKNLKGTRILPLKISATNVSSEAVTLNYADIKLNLNGNRTLIPVKSAVIADLIRKGERYPRLLGFLAGQGAAFAPNPL